MKKTVRSFPRRRDFLRSAPPSYLAGAQACSPTTRACAGAPNAGNPTPAALPQLLPGGRHLPPSTTRASATLPPAASTGRAGAPPLLPRARAREARRPRPSLSSSSAAGTSLPRPFPPPLPTLPAWRRWLRPSSSRHRRLRPSTALPNAARTSSAPPGIGASGSGPPRRRHERIRTSPWWVRPAPASTAIPMVARG